MPSSLAVGCCVFVDGRLNCGRQHCQATDIKPNECKGQPSTVSDAGACAVATMTDHPSRITPAKCGHTRRRRPAATPLATASTTISWRWRLHAMDEVVSFLRSLEGTRCQGV